MSNRSEEVQIDGLVTVEADAIAQALRSLSVASSVFCLSELSAPWGFRVGGAGLAKFHLVLSGAAWLRVAGHDPVELFEGDLVILPHGQAHSISNQRRGSVPALDDLIAEFPLDSHLRLRNTGGGPMTRLLCGGFTLSNASVALMALLPDILHIGTSTMFATKWLEPVLLALDAEDSLEQPGAVAIKEKIADVFVAQALRAWMVGAGDAGWRAPAQPADPHIDKALDLMRNRFSDRWTLDQMASRAGLSRTAFITRFRTAIGETPMRHLTKQRLGNAAGYLGTDDRSLYEIALLTGYDNDAALSKAFRRECGVSPGAYRKASRQRPHIETE